MAYTNAIFYLDHDLGSDAVRTTLSGIVFSNPSGDIVLGTKVAHGLVTGAVITVSGCTQAYANSAWKITWVSADTFTLDNASWASFTGADVTGDGVPFGGMSWTDAWKTLTLGATAARIAPGDIIRIAKSPAPIVKAAVNIVSSTDASPINIEANAHGLTTNDQVVIAGHEVNVAANGTWTITKVDANNFTLNGSTGSGAGAGGATGTSTIVGIGVARWTGESRCISDRNVAGTANNGAGLIRITTSGATSLVTGDVVQILSVVGTVEANGNWLVTYIDSTHYDLVDSAYVNAYTSGGSTLRITTKTVVLNSAQTVNIDLCETAWTPGVGGDTTVTKVAVTTSPYGKEGPNYMKFALDASPQVSILQAYYPTGELDLSSYQKISFWWRSNGATIANNLEIKLCSDVAGATPVDTFSIPAIVPYDNWMPITLARDGGGNLGASIKSIAIYTGSDVTGIASKLYFIDDIIACKSSGLNLQSLISKNSVEQGGAEGWYGIQSINNTLVQLDNSPSTGGNAGQGYGGTTETVSTYIRETIKTTPGAVDGTIVSSITDSGTVGNNIQFQGGYDTSTTLQTGETFLDGLNGRGRGLTTSSRSYVTLNWLSFYRYYDGLYAVYGTKLTIDNLSNCSNNTYCGIDWTTVTFVTINNLLNVNNNTAVGIFFNTVNIFTISYIGNVNGNIASGIQMGICTCGVIVQISNINNNHSNTVAGGLDLGGCHNVILNILSNISYNGYAITNNTASLNFIINSLTTIGNVSGAISTYRGLLFINKASIAESTKVNFPAAADYYDPTVFIQQLNGDSDAHWIYTDNGTINSLATDRVGGTGIMWKMAITNSKRDSYYPLKLSIAKIAVAGSGLVTVKAYMKKDHATNVIGQLRCRVGQITWSDGASDIIEDCSSADTDWHEITLTFTPIEKGVVEIEALAYYVTGNSNVYIEDMTITQA